MERTPELVESLAAAVSAGMPRARADLTALVALPSVYTRPNPPEVEFPTPPNPPEVEFPTPPNFPEVEFPTLYAAACLDAATLVADLLTEVGIQDVCRVPADDGSLAVTGHTPGPPGTPTVLLYAHYDVQPPGPLDAWDGSPWELTERGGRWYGRGAADCKGNLVMLLTALRALREVGDGTWPVGIRVLVEGSEEASTGGTVRLVGARPGLAEADVMVVADTGNVELGLPTLTTSLRGTGSVKVTVRTMREPVHSGMYGGAAPDALAALIAMLATLRSPAGDTTIDGLDDTGVWPGASWPPERFRDDAGVLPGVDLLGSGSVADTVWARPAVTVLALDAPRIAEATAAVSAKASALVNLRVPPGVDAMTAQDLLVAQLHRVAPWGVEVEVERLTLGQPWAGRTSGPVYDALAYAMDAAFGRSLVTTGQGGSIPLCTALAAAWPDADILLLGVEEPACRIHSPGESVDPGELERTALGLALFLASVAAVSSPPPSNLG